MILPQSDIVLAVAGLSALYRPLGRCASGGGWRLRRGTGMCASMGTQLIPKKEKDCSKKCPFRKIRL
ncbi:MAG: hypothetical protein ACLR8P_17380 [Clostridium fessum]